MGIESLCDALGIEVSTERNRELQLLDAAGLERLLSRLRGERRWS